MSITLESDGFVESSREFYIENDIICKNNHFKSVLYFKKHFINKNTDNTTRVFPRGLCWYIFDRDKKVCYLVEFPIFYCDYAYVRTKNIKLLGDVITISIGKTDMSKMKEIDFIFNNDYVRTLDNLIFLPVKSISLEQYNQDMEFIRRGEEIINE